MVVGKWSDDYRKKHELMTKIIIAKTLIIIYLRHEYRLRYEQLLDGMTKMINKDQDILSFGLKHVKQLKNMFH